MQYAAEQENSYREILGVRFFCGDAQRAKQIGLNGGLVVVPAAPALVDLPRDRSYREALLDADLAITDSACMVLIWNLLTQDHVHRVSGLRYLRLLLQESSVKEQGKSFWIMPTHDSLKQNLQWLQSQGVKITEDDCYVAPMYEGESVCDDKLLNILTERRPNHIIVALGGGTQEKLGHFLKGRLPYRPGIHCIGAAIAFLSGDQVKIPDWADRFFLGWLFRTISQPSKFFPRYWKARKLVPLVWKYRNRLPPSI
jgi:N-acetylglucosaminyldiphosphoundecaprenol N-acetyl-beta-D-mannosaminyltransferase